MLVRRLEADFRHSNESGSLVQLVHEGWHQVNVLESLHNTERGGHYHKENKEAFYIIRGKLLLTLEHGDEHEETEFHEGDMFMILPYLKHRFFFLEDTLMVAMYSGMVERPDGKKDIYTE